MAITLVVQVTDDSPQHIRYVSGADVLMVPSIETKNALLSYTRKEKLPRTKIVVNPYPLSPVLTSRLSRKQFAERTAQVESTSRSAIHCAVPVSGAAVGLQYASRFMEELHRINDRFSFHVISKNAAFTQLFLTRMKRRDYVTVYDSSQDKKVVEAYDTLYKQKLISFELTKPSEQAFKALLSPKQAGGSLLLFSHPVGRQEYDNINFLRKHELIPSEEEQDRILQFAREDIGFAETTDENLYKKAAFFRGIRLPDSPEQGALLMQWGINKGLFCRMVTGSKMHNQVQEYSQELGSDGVELFWNYISDHYLTNH
jgi:hypothetical protein